MIAVDTIEKALTMGALNAALMFIPDVAASETELARAAKAIGRQLSEPHTRILKRWNGLNLDIVRVYGTTGTTNELRSLSESQLEDIAALPVMVAFGDDPSGFIYAEDPSGNIISFDSSCGEFDSVAPDMDDFFCRLVFGRDAERFASAAWLDSLKAAGMGS